MPMATTGQDHVLEAVVAGPDGANRLYTCTGVAYASIQAGPGAPNVTQTFTFPIGPTLQRRQFIRGIVTAMPDLQLSANAVPMNVLLKVVSVEADWDDESQRTEVRVELTAHAGGSQSYLYTSELRYWATILAEVPST